MIYFVPIPGFSCFFCLVSSQLSRGGKDACHPQYITKHGGIEARAPRVTNNVPVALREAQAEMDER